MVRGVSLVPGTCLTNTIVSLRNFDGLASTVPVIFPPSANAGADIKPANAVTTRMRGNFDMGCSSSQGLECGEQADFDRFDLRSDGCVRRRWCGGEVSSSPAGVGCTVGTLDRRGQSESDIGAHERCNTRGDAEVADRARSVERDAQKLDARRNHEPRVRQPG